MVRLIGRRFMGRCWGARDICEELGSFCEETEEREEMSEGERGEAQRSEGTTKASALLTNDIEDGEGRCWIHGICIWETAKRYPRDT
jgi:hypothetical protein